MTYSDFYKILEEYTTKEIFSLLDIDIKKYPVSGKLVYSYKHLQTSYFVVNNFDSLLQDKIEIALYKEAQKLIRQRKINKLLNDNI